MSQIYALGYWPIEFDKTYHKLYEKSKNDVEVDLLGGRGGIEHNPFEKGNKVQDDESSISSNNIVVDETSDIIINNDHIGKSNNNNDMETNIKIIDTSNTSD